MEVDLAKKLELINKIDFFTRFEEEDKRTMAGLADFEKYQAGDKLITQASKSSKLFFIINGSVDIVIDGKTVRSLHGGGHVFGEVSFVHFGPTSASVVATTKVVAMVFDTNGLNHLEGPPYHRLKMQIYHSCAETLALRLIQTNAMAASFIKNQQQLTFEE